MKDRGITSVGGRGRPRSSGPPSSSKEYGIEQTVPLSSTRADKIPARLGEIVFLRTVRENEKEIKSPPQNNGYRVVGLD